jgi:hypothetical protein
MWSHRSSPRDAGHHSQLYSVKFSVIQRVNACVLLCGLVGIITVCAWPLSVNFHSHVMNTLRVLNLRHMEWDERTSGPFVEDSLIPMLDQALHLPWMLNRVTGVSVVISHYVGAADRWDGSGCSPHPHQTVKAALQHPGESRYKSCSVLSVISYPFFVSFSLWAVTARPSFVVKPSCGVPIS